MNTPDQILAGRTIKGVRFHKNGRMYLTLDGGEVFTVNGDDWTYETQPSGSFHRWLMTLEKTP